jgi:hypothetical protein
MTLKEFIDDLTSKKSLEEIQDFDLVFWNQDNDEMNYNGAVISGKEIEVDLG